jgi:hypothetical protein
MYDVVLLIILKTKNSSSLLRVQFPRYTLLVNNARSTKKLNVHDALHEISCTKTALADTKTTLINLT